MGNEGKNHKITGVTFVIVRPDGKMLLQLRDANSRFYPNQWCFPGEGSEDNEELFDTVCRGIQEEFGMKVGKSICDFLAINHRPEIAQEIPVFVCRIDNNQEPELREGKAMRWMDMSEVKGLELGYEQRSLAPLIEIYLRKHQIPVE